MRPRGALNLLSCKSFAPAFSVALRYGLRYDKICLWSKKLLRNNILSIYLGNLDCILCIFGYSYVRKFWLVWLCVLRTTANYLNLRMTRLYIIEFVNISIFTSLAITHQPDSVRRVSHKALNVLFSSRAGLLE